MSLTMVPWLQLRGTSGRSCVAGTGRRSTVALVAAAFLPSAMSFFRGGLGVGANAAIASRPTEGRLFCAYARLTLTYPMNSATRGRDSCARYAAAFSRGGGTRGLAMVSGGGASSSSSLMAPPHDFIKQATRFESCFADGDGAGQKKAVPITVLADKAAFDEWLESQSRSSRSWIKSLGRDSHKAGRMVMVPSAEDKDGEGGGSLAEVAFCLGEGDDAAGSPFTLCSLRDQLPAGTYSLRGANGDVSEPDAAALSWALGGYSFDRYKSSPKGDEEAAATAAAEKKKVLTWPKGANKERVSAAAASTFLVRDLITTPCEDMGPQHLEAVFSSMAEEFGGSCKVVKGDDLLKEGDAYPMIHAVGRAAGVGREPRLLDLTWTPPDSDGDLPKVTLVGKGVCFDTGGLDIKPAAGMLTMKKDMGGAAQVIGLARMIMSQKLPVRLRVLVPAVENAINGEAFRPGDVIVARSGKTSEIGNTDAEGRLVLADALVEASTEMPDLLIDCATLTGAARVALGTEIPVVFCNNEAVAAKLLNLSGGVADQVWRLPLWEGYRKQLSSKIADLRNVGAGGYGGAITAALYLDEFVGKKATVEGEASDEGTGDEGQASPPPPAAKSGDEKLAWIHMDFMAFNQASRPGRPEGGEAQGMRALYALLEDMYGA